jgi:hypothetical protein
VGCAHGLAARDRRRTPARKHVICSPLTVSVRPVSNLPFSRTRCARVGDQPTAIENSAAPTTWSPIWLMGMQPLSGFLAGPISRARVDRVLMSTNSRMAGRHRTIMVNGACGSAAARTRVYLSGGADGSFRRS